MSLAGISLKARHGNPILWGFVSGLFIERVVAIRYPTFAVQRQRNRRREREKVTTSQTESVITGLSKCVRDVPGACLRVGRRLQR